MKVSRILEEVLKASEFAWWSYDPSSGVASFSEGFHALLGLKPGDLSPTLEGWTALLHPEEAREIEADFRRSPGTDSERELRLRTASGGWRWVRVRWRAVTESHPAAAVMVGTAVDITQRKLAERALANSEARWTSLVDEAPVGISLIRKDGVVMFMNRFESGFHEVPTVGHPWKQFLPDELHLEADWVMETAFVQGKSVVFESYRTLSSGTISRFENHVSPVRESGEIRALLILSLDITASYRTRRRQAKATHRMEVLLDLHSDRQVSHRRLFEDSLKAALELTDSGTGQLFLYDAARGRFTLQASAPGQPEVLSYAFGTLGAFDQAVTRRDPVVINSVLEASHLPLGILPAELLLRRYLAVPVIDQEEVVAVIGVGNKVLPYDDDDIDELQLLSGSLWHLLRRSETEATLERLFQAVEHTPVSVVITGTQGEVQYANPRYFEAVELGSHQVLGKPYLPLSPNSTDAVSLELRAALLAGEDWKGETTRRRQNGAEVTEWVSASPVKDGEGQIRHFIVVKEDITERKAAQEMLSRNQKMETVGQLAAGVAHDFNNFLTSILGYNEMLLRKLEPGNALRAYPEGIERSGRRAAELVSGLLAVGRQQYLAKSRIDLALLLREEVPLLASLAHGRVKIDPDAHPGPLLVEVDPGQVNQVIVNLVSNARDATEAEGSPIRLNVGRTEGDRGPCAWFSVRDEGPGIPSEVQEKIFEPFFTTKPIGKGTGLGLSIVHGIVQQHQGTISVESSPGKGTQFTVSFPLIEPPA